jgi:AAA family ATP:ADP antiporter
METEPRGFIARLLKRVADVEPDEVAAVVTAFFLFFCVMGGYFAVRPVRETVGTLLGRDRVSDLFVVTWIVTLAIIPLYGAITARWARSRFLPWIYGFIALALVAVGLTLRASEDNLAVGTFFYVFISVINLFVISVFWSFLLELFNKDQTKRLFGAIAAGGTAGALAGPMLTDLLVGTIGNAGILLFGASLFTLAIVLQRVLLRLRARAAWLPPEAQAQQERPIGGSLWAGVTLILKSPYLLGIALFVIFIATANTILYLQQVDIVSRTFADTVERTRVFSRLDYTVQSLTIILQLTITGRIANRLGVGVLLTLLPIAMIGGFLTLAATGTFAVFAVVMVTRRVGEYAFIRPGREMLFGGLDTETKYKAKNTIDVPVYRGADALVAQVDKALAAAGWSAAAMATLGAAVAAAWAVNGFLLGRAQRAQAERQ